MTPHAGTYPSGEASGVQARPSETDGVASPDIDALVSRRLRYARVANGWSQSEFADRVGLSLQQVHKYETARNRIGPARLVQFARTLDVPIDWLFGGPAVETNQTTDGANRDVVAFVGAFKRIRDTRQQAAVLALLRSLGSETPHNMQIGGDEIGTRE